MMGAGVGVGAGTEACSCSREGSQLSVLQSGQRAITARSKSSQLHSCAAASPFGGIASAPGLDWATPGERVSSPALHITRSSAGPLTSVKKLQMPLASASFAVGVHCSPLETSCRLPPGRVSQSARFSLLINASIIWTGFLKLDWVSGIGAVEVLSWDVVEGRETKTSSSTGPLNARSSLSCLKHANRFAIIPGCVDRAQQQRRDRRRKLKIPHRSSEAAAKVVPEGTS